MRLQINNGLQDTAAADTVLITGPSARQQQASAGRNEENRGHGGVDSGTSGA